MAMISEILRFTLPRSSANASAFHGLRRQVAEKGPVKAQYFGYVMPDVGLPPPKKEDLMCWYIGILVLRLPINTLLKICPLLIAVKQQEWPEASNFRRSAEFKTQIAELAATRPRSLLFKFRQTKDNEVIRGLEAAACEFVCKQFV